MSWGSGHKKGLPPGLDTFEARQEPQVESIDELSRFVLNSIYDQETEPRIEVLATYHQPAGPMAHRYAAKVRADCVAFRRVVLLYVEATAAVEAAENQHDRAAAEERAVGLRMAVSALAARWSNRHGYKDEWAVSGLSK